MHTTNTPNTQILPTIQENSSGFSVGSSASSSDFSVGSSASSSSSSSNEQHVSKTSSAAGNLAKGLLKGLMNAGKNTGRLLTGATALAAAIPLAGIEVLLNNGEADGSLAIAKFGVSKLNDGFKGIGKASRHLTPISEAFGKAFNEAIGKFPVRKTNAQSTNTATNNQTDQTYTINHEVKPRERHAGNTNGGTTIDLNADPENGDNKYAPKEIEEAFRNNS